MKELRTVKGKSLLKRQLIILPGRQKHICQSKAAGSSKAPWLFILPSLAGTAVFTLIPFADVVRRSFMEAYSGKFAGLENYRTVLGNSAFRLAVGNTLRFIAVCIPLLLLISLMVSLGINLMGRTKRFFQASFLIPMAVPVASVVLFWKLVFDYHGYLNSIMEVFHVPAVDWMNQKTAFGVLVFCYIWKNMGYFIVLWLAGLNSIPASYYEAAKVDGANSWICFKYITMPLLVPTVFMVTILAFVNSFKVFREAYLISGDYPHESIYLIQHLFNNWFAGLDIQKMCSAAVILAAGISLIICIMLNVTKDRE